MDSVSAEKLTEMSSSLHGLGECHVENGSWKVAEIINQFLDDYYSAWFTQSLDVFTLYQAQGNVGRAVSIFYTYF